MDIHVYINRNYYIWTLYFLLNIKSECDSKPTHSWLSNDPVVPVKYTSGFQMTLLCLLSIKVAFK